MIQKGCIKKQISWQLIYQLLGLEGHISQTGINKLL